MRRLKCDGRRAVIDLSGEAAHGSGKADDPAIIEDHQIIGCQDALDVVKGLQLRAGRHVTSPDRSLQLRGVKGMQRLAKLEHHVVGDIDGQ